MKERKEKIDIKSICNEKIIKDLEERIALLEKGDIVSSWKCPWKRLGAARNYITKRKYSIRNQILLEGEGGYYAGFKQWKDCGGVVKKGEHGKMITYLAWYKKKDKEGNYIKDEDGEFVKFPKILYLNVFHQSQIEGIQFENIGPVENQDRTDEEKCLEIINILEEYCRREGIKVEEDDMDKAFFIPARNIIHLPKRESFFSLNEFVATFAHECGHSTGIKLGRELKNSFGNEKYSREELVAEITSAALLNSVGLQENDRYSNQLDYLISWLKSLKNDKHMFYYAAGQAEKAVKMILNEEAEKESSKEE